MPTACLKVCVRVVLGTVVVQRLFDQQVTLLKQQPEKESSRGKALLSLGGMGDKEEEANSAFASGRKAAGLPSPLLISEKRLAFK